MKKIKNIFKGIFLILFFVFLSVSFYFFLTEFIHLDSKQIEPKKQEKKKEEKPKKEEYHLTLGMVGDALYHTGVFTDGRTYDSNANSYVYNYDSQLSLMAPIISEYDLAYYNQESILGGTELGLSSYPMFNSPQEVGDAYLNAGFNLVSLANNHTLDKGERGILKSVEYWRGKKEAMTAGSYDSFEDRNRSHVGEKNGIKYAFFAYTDTTNGLTVPSGKEYLVNVFDKEKVKEDILKVKDEVDVILVSMHWGEEYTHTPTTTQRDEAEYLASLGVNVIIGSHPHVIQPIEHIGDTVVVYSLGNFISGQNGTEKKVGLLASLEINKVVENGKTTISIDNVKGDLTYTYHQNFKNFKVIPFYQLTNNELYGYENIKTQYEAILNKNDDSIIVGSLGA